jgi:hypothetical protein
LSTFQGQNLTAKWQYCQNSFAGRMFQLEDISEVDPDEVPGSAVA